MILYSKACIVPISGIRDRFSFVGIPDMIQVLGYIRGEIGKAVRVIYFYFRIKILWGLFFIAKEKRIFMKNLPKPASLDHKDFFYMAF